MGALRLFGLLSVLVALAAVGYLYSASSDALTGTSAGPTPSGEVGAAYILQAAATGLESAHRAPGTYAGARIDGVQNVQVIRADATSYCIQLHLGMADYHQNGPNGKSEPGPC